MIEPESIKIAAEMVEAQHAVPVQHIYFASYSILIPF